MAKKTLLIQAPNDHPYARMAESALASTIHRFGMNWIVKRSEVAGEADHVVNELPTTETEVEAWSNQIIATLLGGGQPPPPVPPPPPAKKPVQTAKLSRETAGRRGKGVTVVSELPLNDGQWQELCTHLKNKCGTGGSFKDGRIEIQGDLRDRIQQELEKLGYKVKRSGG